MSSLDQLRVPRPSATQAPTTQRFSPDPMRVIVFSSQKGGSGKTTLCGQLAVQASRSGVESVAVVDTDPQGSLAEWWNARADQTPLFVKTRVDRLVEDLEELRMMGVQLVFVDTQPSVTDVIREIVACADLVVIPTRPSPHDLRAVGATLDIVEGQNKPLIFAVNGATRRARITSDVAVALSQHGTVAPVTVHQRTDFATSMINGGSVMEADEASASAKEIISLWDYLAVRLQKLDRVGDNQTFDHPLQASAPSHSHSLDHRPGQGPAFGRRPTQPPAFGRRQAAAGAD